MFKQALVNKMDGSGQQHIDKKAHGAEDKGEKHAVALVLVGVGQRQASGQGDRGDTGEAGCDGNDGKEHHRVGSRQGADGEDQGVQGG